MKVKNAKRGFTTMELMIVLAVLAVLAAVAYPTFKDIILKSRRSQAIAGLGELQLAEEKWRANTTIYAGTLASLNFPASGTIVDGYYKASVLVVSATAATDYKITAAPQTKGGQDKDKCGSFILRKSGGNLVQSIVTAYTATISDCWKR